MRKNVGKKKLLLTVLSALTLSLAATIGAFADESDTSKLVSGTKINGVGVGGLTPDEAKARIEGFYAGEYTLNIKEKGGKEESIKGSDIGYQVTVSGSIQNILDSQNATGRVAGPSGENTHTMEVSAQYNEEALNNKISNLSCISGGSIVTTKDASISAYEEGKEFTIVPAVQGNDVDPEKTKQVITAVVRAGSRELSLEETGCYRTVGVWESDENLKALCAAMNSRRTKQLRYVFGDASEVLSGETMASWITGSSNGQVTLDQEKVAAFVANLAATYDTAGKTRTFTGVTGAEYQLTGPYGWKIDQAGEIAALTELIQSGSAWQDGDSADREPVYSQSAVSRTGGDWGNTYVQVDLGGQHVYMVKDGTVVWDAPCVTGNVSKDYTTPAGIYSLTYKEKDRILRGKKLDNGKYEYESHVDYWMPFNGGIGLHDASWRSKFGGTIYQTSGNPYGHIIMRGGKKPNYHAQDIAAACETLAEFDLPEHLVVDFSHGNCQKQHRRQLDVCDEICQQIVSGSTAIAGIMAESFIREGTQKIVAGQPMVYGQSITDPCLSWEDSELLLEKLAAAVDSRF